MHFSVATWLIRPSLEGLVRLFPKAFIEAEPDVPRPPMREGGYWPPPTSALAPKPSCNYSMHMPLTKLKIAQIGNSRGVRLPAATLKRYHIGDSVVMEERSDGILLRPVGPAVEKLSWADTAREMASAGEDWSEWDASAADGLSHVPWDSSGASRVAESRAPSTSKTHKRARR